MQKAKAYFLPIWWKSIFCNENFRNFIGKQYSNSSLFAVLRNADNEGPMFWPFDVFFTDKKVAN